MHFPLMNSEHMFGKFSDNLSDNYEIDSIPENLRNKKPSELFTLWFAANLTVGDFAVGFIPVELGLNIYYAILAIIIGNVLGSALLGVMSLTGPRTGLPQMVISRYGFGKRFGIFISGLQWINTMGWLTVNLVLAGFALSLALHFSVYEIPVFVTGIIILLISYLGRNIISHFERAMSIVLGIIFSFIVIDSLIRPEKILLYHGVYSGIGFGITLASTFSYIMSWAPYAADYSRYNQDKGSVFTYSFAGGMISSIWAEIAGLFVAILSVNPDLNPALDLKDALGYYGFIGLYALFLGGIAADAINLYSNSLSMKSMGIKIKRRLVSIIGISIAIIVSMIAYNKFYLFYEDFLFILDYWITPWIGIMIASFFIDMHGKPLAGIPGFNVPGILSYFISLGASVPFMDPGFLYEGVISKLYLGGVDISYYVSFLLSIPLYIAIRKLIKNKDIVINAQRS
ncbi:allantoin permease family protein [Picrophilus oshimae DSM 9789]|uniref:Allantoin permease family protein n=2 Tax=Picrophilus oshimae TaxID=46632 RepID=Q6L2T6_PICTO|nr:allantoin permease family protein [Picrophilus oshimae DSM 9789]